MRILIVEDEPGISAFLKEGLEEESFAVDVAEDGPQALEMGLVETYDVILLDWMLPGLSGLEVCQRWRAKGMEAPIIFLTARDTVGDTVQGLRAGANDYLKKPFAFEELLERIRVQMRPQAEVHHRFTLDDLVLDTDLHRVLRGEEEILLTPKEFALLEYLIRNKGRVCRRTQIIEHVWDMHFDADTSVIDVYINFLRKKLQHPDGRTYIRTLRGVGYIVSDPA
ncbi:MAG: DNA-binding response regulator [Bacteroidetes bacterium]|nr:MAG: DNA-binding response regulator [Bacteroidota bacterium]